MFMSTTSRHESNHPRSRCPHLGPRTRKARGVLWPSVEAEQRRFDAIGLARIAASGERKDDQACMGERPRRRHGVMLEPEARHVERAPCFYIHDSFLPQPFGPPVSLVESRSHLASSGHLTSAKMNMMKILALFLGITFFSTAAQAQLASISVGPRPESIVKGWGGKFYVSIQGPSGNLGVFDGEIRQVELGTGVVTTLVSGLENPRGLAFTGQFLVAADQQKIWKIDETGNKTVLAEATKFPFSANFFNDAATESGGKAVYVTEMGRRDLMREVPPSPVAGHLIPPDSEAAYAIAAVARVYRITMDGKVTSVFEPSRKLLVINGVTETKKRKTLLVLDFFHGNVVEVDAKKNTKTILATGLRGADGVEQASDGTIFVSSFENGAVWRMDANGENMKRLISGVGFQTTADFYLDEPTKLLYVPNTAAGTILVIATEVIK